MKPHTARFRFYEELNDFLPSQKRKQRFEYRFDGKPAVKDAIEAIGIPHTEVDLIVLNGTSVDFKTPLRDGDEVAVYPVFEAMDLTPIIRLRPKPLRRTRFILDGHLGKLARYLRLLGFDSLYRNDYRDDEIILIANRERRIILTRDIGILKTASVTRGIWIRSQRPDEQVKEVLDRLDLKSQVDPFKRCMVCNASVQPVAKEAIVHRLKPRTKRYYDTFVECRKCGHIYWKGSHHENMAAKIEQWLS